MKRILSFAFSLCLFTLSLAQNGEHGHVHSRQIVFPDILGYQTLVCDFHIHTVFSDGNVWPTIRVEEAVKDGVDAISLTEHIEYQPHGQDIPHPDRNRSYQLTKDFAEAMDVLMIHGAEITRGLPPGHANALFITDANKLNVDNAVEAYAAVKAQDGFVFWNHPNWIAQQRNGLATLTELHDSLIGADLLHGIEVVNDVTYSDEALEIALNHDLTIIGTSDIHGLVDWQYDIENGGHRPVSLVFATERTIPAIKEALRAKRTVAFFNDLIIGREALIKPLIKSSISFQEGSYQGPSSVVTVMIKNLSNSAMLLRNTSDYTFHAHNDIVQIAPMGETKLEVKTLEQVESFDLSFEILNGVMGQNKHPEVSWNVKVNLDE